MYKSEKTFGSSKLFQAITAPAWGLVLAVAVQACSSDGSGDVNTQDEALKGGMPANDHGKGRPRAAVAGASGGAETDDRDASVNADCPPDMDIGARQSAMHGKGKSAASNTDPAAMKGKSRGGMGDKGQSGAHGKGKGAQANGAAGVSTAGAADEDDDSTDDADDADDDD